MFKGKVEESIHLTYTGCSFVYYESIKRELKRRPYIRITVIKNVVRGTGTPEDRVPSKSTVIRKGVSLTRVSPTLDLICEESRKREIHSVTHRNKDEVNRREVCECDG